MIEKGLCQQYLTPLRGKATHKPVIAFDVETHGTKNRFVLGCISHADRNEIYHNAREMLEALGNPRNISSLIYATNLHFDAFTLFNEVAGNQRIPPEWQAFDNGSKLIWCKKQVTKGPNDTNNRHVTLLDSMNLFPIGVYNLGNILQKVSKTYARQGNTAAAEYYNVKKLEAPPHMGKKSFAGLTRAERESLEEYCAMDATVTRKFMEWANREIVELGAKVKITAASTSMDLFRRKYLSRVIPQPPWDCLVDSRYSYYGGRTEDYWKGNVGAGVEQDITAMYPSIMESIQFPYPSPENFTKDDRPTDHCLEGEGFTMATMSLRPTGEKQECDLRYPALPFKTDAHLMFPIGALQGVWTNYQLRHALEHGWEIEKLHWSYSTHHTFNPFEEYVRSLMSLRLEYLCPGCAQHDQSGLRCWQLGLKCENAHATEEVIKLFLNGLYGKFAQNFLTEEQALEVKQYVKKGGGTYKSMGEATQEELTYTMVNHPEYLAQGIVINKAAPSLKSFMNPILASYVTSGAQCKINTHQVKAHQMGIQVYYTDTDSLLTDRPLPWATKAKSLGDLQLVGPFDELIIVGPKAKLVKHGKDEKATFKGVPDKSWLVTDKESMASEEIRPRKAIFEAMQKDSLSVKYTRMAKMRESVHRGLSTNEMVEMTKTFKPFENPKRRILGRPRIRDLLSQKFDTTPWIVDGKTQLIMR